jgi:hypothetical protein
MSPELNNEMTRRRKCRTCFSGAFAKLRKENNGFVMSVCPHWKNSPTEQIFMKFDI